MGPSWRDTTVIPPTCGLRPLPEIRCARRGLGRSAGTDALGTCTMKLSLELGADLTCGPPGTCARSVKSQVWRTIYQTYIGPRQSGPYATSSFRDDGAGSASDGTVSVVSTVKPHVRAQLETLRCANATSPTCLRRARLDPGACHGCSHGTAPAQIALSGRLARTIPDAFARAEEKCVWSVRRRPPRPLPAYHIAHLGMPSAARDSCHPY